MLIGNYEISDICFLSNPCLHYVKDLRTGEAREMNGCEIYKLLEQDGLSNPHFNKHCFPHITIGQYDISTRCLSRSCKHNIFYIDTGKYSLISGKELYALLKSKKLRWNHLKQFSKKKMLENLT